MAEHPPPLVANETDAVASWPPNLKWYPPNELKASPEDHYTYTGQEYIVTRSSLKPPIKLWLDGAELINKETLEERQINNVFDTYSMYDENGIHIFVEDNMARYVNLNKGDILSIGEQLDEKHLPYPLGYKAQIIKNTNDDRFSIKIRGTIRNEDFTDLTPAGSLSSSLFEKTNNPMFKKAINNSRFAAITFNAKLRKKKNNLYEKERLRTAELPLPSRIKTRKTFGGTNRIRCRTHVSSKKTRKTRKMRKTRHYTRSAR